MRKQDDTRAPWIAPVMLRSFFDKRHAEYAIYRQNVCGVTDPIEAERAILFTRERMHGIYGLHVAWTN